MKKNGLTDEQNTTRINHKCENDGTINPQQPTVVLNQEAEEEERQGSDQ
jgi:hypothetical protein